VASTLAFCTMQLAILAHQPPLVLVRQDMGMLYLILSFWSKLLLRIGIPHWQSKTHHELFAPVIWPECVKYSSSHPLYPSSYKLLSLRYFVMEYILIPEGPSFRLCVRFFVFLMKSTSQKRVPYLTSKTAVKLRHQVVEKINLRKLVYKK
jgi:hypothetical protein